jgi:hypothetical protein
MTPYVDTLHENTSEMRSRAFVESQTGNPGAHRWCDTCKAIQRKPRGGWECPMCSRPVLSTEQRNEPNHLLYRHWRAVFRRIPGFERCICLRRVRCPDRSGDMDFLLLQPWPRPRLGLVEVAGWNSRKDVPKGVEDDINQLSRYLEAFRQHAGDGSTILRESIDNAFDVRNQRGENNVRRWRNRTRWARALPDVRNDARLTRLLESASRMLVPILLCFSRESSGGLPLTDKEARHLDRALRGHRTYVGIIGWPAAERLLRGRYYLPARQR